MTFWSCRENGSSRKLVSTFKVGFKVYDVTVWLSNNYDAHVVQYLTKKDNQTMKFGQLIEHNKTNNFLWKSSRKRGTDTSSKPLFLFLKSFIWSKSKCSAAYFQYISIALNLAYNKDKLHKTLFYWFRDMLNFDFLKKGLGLVSQPHFVYDFSR